MMTINTHKLLPWVPVVVLACTVVGSAMVDNFRITANAEELDEAFEDIEDNQDDIDKIERVLIQRQGEVQLKVQRIETEQKEQGQDISEILRLLKEERGRGD